MTAAAQAIANTCDFQGYVAGDLQHQVAQSTAKLRFLVKWITSSGRP